MAGRGFLAVITGALSGCQILFPLEPGPPPPPPLAASIVAGRDHTCAERQGDRTIRCWGRGEHGRLGYGNTDTIGDDEPAGDAGDLPLSNVELALGGEHTCGWSAAGVRCWGNNADGQLGYGNMEVVGDNENLADLTPVELDGEVVSVAVGGAHVCALLAGGPVTCWGSGSSGQLGLANTLDIGDNEPPQAPIPGITALAIATGTAHSCALLTDSQVMCWGLGADGRLGYNGTENVGAMTTPVSAGTVQIADPFGIQPLEALKLTAGDAHTCALLTNNTITCWGRGVEGQLGLGNSDSLGDDELVNVGSTVPLGMPALDVVAGANHTCALLATKNVRCWGDGSAGQLGYGNTDNVGDVAQVPEVDVELGEPAIAIAAGGDHTCALLESGNVMCWGSAANGELGYGDTNTIGDDETPASVGPVPVF